ncbi:protein of unknown function [Xenorhabdus poinarii G6]|uniref:Uncharacterized protein n=1 Tax=Xenorhabdus poinarii G6 TaxID=1354304 RepID=A0A068R5Y8_9GAMM|nr:protein of unknown function [Xenorhabdus poinarii G6]
MLRDRKRALSRSIDNTVIERSQQSGNLKDDGYIPVYRKMVGEGVDLIHPQSG